MKLNKSTVLNCTKKNIWLRLNFGKIIQGMKIDLNVKFIISYVFWLRQKLIYSSPSRNARLLKNFIYLNKIRY